LQGTTSNEIADATCNLSTNLCQGLGRINGLKSLALSGSGQITFSNP
jgi:hypothetical protein